MKLAVVGLGLIGGSIGVAARQKLDACVAGFDVNVAALARGRERGAIDIEAASLEEALDGAEVALIAAPVGALPELIRAVLDKASKDCVVTDVGSTKRAVKALHADERFVGGHPLAGAETAGVEHARADLFDGATWYLTPTATTEGVLYERLHRLIAALGAKPVAIDADAHDQALGLVSHLPHVLANVLASQAAAGLGKDQGPPPTVGPSFRDATRVAGANSKIWTDIYLANRDTLATQIDETITRLQRVKRALSEADGAELTAWNDTAAKDRKELLESQLADGDLHELRIPVPNKPGIVAEIALELGRIGVNIADLALYPAPDMREGVVAVWVAGEQDTARAQQRLKALQLPVIPA